MFVARCSYAPCLTFVSFFVCLCKCSPRHACIHSHKAFFETIVMIPCVNPLCMLPIIPNAHVILSARTTHHHTPLPRDVHLMVGLIAFIFVAKLRQFETRIMTFVVHPYADSLSEECLSLFFVELHLTECLRADLI